MHQHEAQPQRLGLAAFMQRARVVAQSNQGRVEQVLPGSQDLGFVDSLGELGLRQAHKAVGRYEAARVRIVDAKEVPDAPARFSSLEEARQFIADTPVSHDGVRPWIRDCSESNWRMAFLVIAGKDKQPFGSAAA